MNYAENLEWLSNGKCRYRVRKTRKCTGPPGYSGGCQGTYTDDYGSHQSCSECHGRGTITWYVTVPVPEFDAPKPDKNWIPDWVET